MAKFKLSFISVCILMGDKLAWVYLLPQAFQKGSPLIGDISKAILNITGGDTIIQIENKWIGDQNNCQNVGTISGTGSLTFGSFEGLIIATGVASTISLVIALIIHFCKSKKVDSEQILQQEETKDGLNEKNQCQEEDRGKGMHEQLKTVMRYGSLVIYRGPRIPSLSISSSARFQLSQLAINLDFDRAQCFIMQISVYYPQPRSLGLNGLLKQVHIIVFTFE